MLLYNCLPYKISIKQVVAVMRGKKCVWGDQSGSIFFGCSNGTLIFQVILQTLLIKAEKKLKDGEKVLKEHENIDSGMAVS